MSRFATGCTKRELTKPEFDRLGDKTRLRHNGNLVASTTIAAAQRRLGGYDHGNGYDHDCCGSTTAAITTLAMVTIAAAMATIAEPMRFWIASPPRGDFYNWRGLLTGGRGYAKHVPMRVREHSGLSLGFNACADERRE